MTTTLNELAARLAEAFVREKSKLRRLANADVTSGEKRNIALVERMAADLHSAIRRFRSEESTAEAIALAEKFVRFGAKAVLLTGSQRGGDFLNNQLRGRWAERVVHSLEVPGKVIVPFGPSGAAMPGEEDHHLVVMTYREITLLEGKRPDLVAFSQERWNALAPDAREAARAWPLRLLSPRDEDVVRQGEFAIEVKNSTWHYEKRRNAGGGPLSITVKEEEVEAIRDWEKKAGLPVLFFQVLFDEIYCMSFKRMRDGIRRGYLYQKGDYELDRTTGADGKVFHRFHLDDLRHRCAKVEFPSKSLAEVRVLPDGNVIPHIDFQPAIGYGIDAVVIEREVAYGREK